MRSPDGASDPPARPPVPSVLADDVGHLMATVAQALGSHELVALHRLGLTLRSYGVLALAAESRLSQQQISELTGIDRTTVVAVVDELERSGLVVREPSPTDRRARLVVPTPEGAQLAERAVALVRDVEARFLAPLAPAEREALSGALQRLADGPLGVPADLSGIPAAPRRRPKRGQPS
ncbi:MAG TPA: MarR family transcriptional regulator [Pseudonocardia sp.]|nr:MarR family transcriptional regulator [Pseudonocardia sp.]